MRFIDPVIMIPWFDTEGMKQRAFLCFKGDVDRRRVYREVRRWAKLNFNKTMPSAEIKQIVAINARTFTNVINPAQRAANRAVGLDALVDEWIKRIQDDTEDEGQPDTGCQADLFEGTELDMPAMPQGSSE